MQAGTNEAGRIEKVELTLPQGVRLTARAGQDAERHDRLRRARLRHHRAAAQFFREKHPDVVRLFPDFEAMEQRYYAGHARLSDHACDRAAQGDPRRQAVGRAQSLQRLRGIQAPQPGAHARSGGVALSGAVAGQLRARACSEIFGGDLFPYGIDANRPTLDLFLRYAHEQGIAHRLAKPEDIFPAGIMASVKV